MSVLTLHDTKSGYFNMLTLGWRDMPDNRKADLTLYVSSLLTEENVSRMAELVDYVAQLTGSFNLQEAAYATQQILGADLQAELRLSSLSPLFYLASYDTMLCYGSNPFNEMIIPAAYQQGTSYPKGFYSDKYRYDCLHRRLLVNAFYNLAYLLRTIKKLTYAWPLAMLAARITEHPDSCMENALTALSTILYRRAEEPIVNRRMPLIYPPKDAALLDTYYQLSANTHVVGRTATDGDLMLHLIFASDTTQYVTNNIPTSVLLESATGRTQSRTKLLPSTCQVLNLGNTGFGIPMLDALSAQGTHVFLLPATKECYRFLCTLYGIAPYDTITPLHKSDALIWKALFHPYMFSQVIELTNPLAEYKRGKTIHNKTAFLTDYIPDLPQTDSPQFMVNEFEVPRYYK